MQTSNQSTAFGIAARSGLVLLARLDRPMRGQCEAQMTLPPPSPIFVSLGLAVGGLFRLRPLRPQRPLPAVVAWEKLPEQRG